MTFDIAPQSFWRFPMVRNIWDDEDDMSLSSVTPSGISISEDEKNIYVEVALPGIDPKNVEMTFDKGVLWVKGESKDEETNKKYYRKATSSFSYRIAVPGELDMNVEPKAESKHGMMTVTFQKSPQSQPKKITIK